MPGDLNGLEHHQWTLEHGRNADDRAMLTARRLVEDHISVYGMVPHPDKMKEAVARAIRDAALSRS